MREISLITGQLHRAIYNLNEEARRAANQKFESGLSSAPQRSLKKAFDQFQESLRTGDPIVRRRTASLLVTLVRAFAAIPLTLQPDVLQLIEMGLADEDDFVREATVESYSLMLPQIDEGRFENEISSKENSQGSQDPPVAATDEPALNKTAAMNDASIKSATIKAASIKAAIENGRSDDAADDLSDAPVIALQRILHIAIADPAEVVREAAAVAVAVQKSVRIKETGVEFFLNHTADRRYRWACRSIESLAEFPDQATMYLNRLDEFLNDGHWRIRRAALLAALRLAKWGVAPWVLLPNVVRRMFESNPKISSIANEVIENSVALISRSDAPLSGFLTECSWLATQDRPREHLAAIVETALVEQQHDFCSQICHDRLVWHATNTADRESAVGISQPRVTADFSRIADREDKNSIGESRKRDLLNAIDRWVEFGGRAGIGWFAGALVNRSIENRS